MRHVRTLYDLSLQEFQDILALSHQLKKNWQQGNCPSPLSHRCLGLLFEKPSLRTRISFEAGMAQLGGSSIFLSQDVGWQTRESTSDFVRVLAEYCDVLVCRTFSHETVEALASYNVIPVINGLTDTSHPCQAMADVMTMQEVFGELKGKQLTFVGDANNVCRSLAHAAAMVGMKFRLLGSPDYFLQHKVIERIQTHARDVDIVQTKDQRAALEHADFVYTDVWTSMGQESESELRRNVFMPLQVNETLMKWTPSHCKVLHCLPARRGEEITDQVIDGDRSVVIQQAGNRMHLQKGLLYWLAIQHGWTK